MKVKRRGTKRQKNKNNFRKLKSPTEKCTECKQPLPASPPEVVAEVSDDETNPSHFEGVARELDEFDVVVLRALRHNRESLQPIYKALRQRYPNWKGQIWHLRPGEKLEHLPISVVQQIYESLMVRFDPDLWKIREERKAKAIQEAAKEEEKDQEMAAHEVADHLERIVADRDQEHVDNIADATRRLEEAKKGGPQREVEEEAGSGGVSGPAGSGGSP